jgi:hypothetical protein
MTTKLIKRCAERPLPSWRRACELQGIPLKYPTRSSSGVRFDDGAVVFAIRAEEVLTEDQYCNVLLWTPPAGDPRPGGDAAASRERLKHCRIAARRGEAVGILVHGERRGVDGDACLALQVEKVANEYWARWRSATRWVEPYEFETASLRLFESALSPRASTALSPKASTA